LDGIHRLLAYAIVALTVTGIGWSMFSVVTRRPGGPAFDRFQVVIVCALVVGAASGLVLIATGATPADGLHLLYAIVAIAFVPLVRSFIGRESTHRAAALLLVAFAALGAVIYRLFATG